MNALPEQRQLIKTFILTTTVMLVVTMAVISIFYILIPKNNFTINQNILGSLGWATLASSTIYVSLAYKKECFFIFFLFIIIGFFTKAYLEPISDQIDHLYRTQEKCRNTGSVLKLNRGLWQYSMNSLLLCESKDEIHNPEKKLFFIDILHGLYISFASTVLYTVSRNSGLPAKWSFLSVLIAVLFMGTNKFSYFRYYSYGPSFTSICIYWTWISFFFFSKEKNKLLYGTLFFILIAPVILVNHVQELIFLSFILLFWLILNLTEKIYSSKKTSHYFWLWAATVFSFFFIFPQFQFFQNFFHSLINTAYPYSISNLWEKNQNVVYYWNSIHVMGKIWIPQYRVAETIGIMGLAPLALAPLIYFCNQGHFPKSEQIRIILLGCLPFLTLCSPLCHYIWATHVQLPVYYRIAYSSLFWITIVYFLYLTEICLKKYFTRRPAQNT